MVCEQCSLCLDTSWTRQQLLRWQRRKFVAYRIAAMWVLLRRIDDFEDTVVDGVSIYTR